MAKEVADAGPHTVSFWIGDDVYDVLWSDIRNFLAAERCEGLYNYNLQFNEMSLSGSPYMITVGLSSWIAQLDLFLWLLEHGIFADV